MIPSEEEIDYLDFANNDCYYFYKGLSECRLAIFRKWKNDPEGDSGHEYLPCLDVT